MRKEIVEKKELEEVILFIRCSRATRRAFKMFTAKYGLPNYEESLKKLLEIAEKSPELIKVVWG